MKRREYIAKFIGDLAKIVFATVVIGQVIAETLNLNRLFISLAFLLTFFILSVVILPKGEKHD